MAGNGEFVGGFVFSDCHKRTTTIKGVKYSSTVAILRLDHPNSIFFLRSPIGVPRARTSGRDHKQLSTLIFGTKVQGFYREASL